MPSTTVFTAGVETDFSTSASPWANFRNLLDGGDFTTNPFQRNITGLATSNNLTTPITSTATYFADRWFGVGNSSSAVMMGVVAANNVAGFSQALTFGRNAGNNNNALITLGQVLETADAIRCQGLPVTFSFWASTNANFSAANNTVTVSVVSSTGNNQTAGNMVGGNWANASNVVSANLSLSNTFTRYSFTGAVPSNSNQLGVSIAYTPNANNAGNNFTDSFNLMGAQFEVGGQASQFEHRDVQVETEICQRYAWVTAEPANNVVVGAGGTTAAANNQTFYMATPVQMRTAPTVTVVAGNFKVTVGGAATAALNMSAGTTHTPNAISITTTAVQAANGAALLQGGGNNGYILASADF